MLEVEGVELELYPGPVVGLQLVLDALPDGVGGGVVGGLESASLCARTRPAVTTEMKFLASIEAIIMLRYLCLSLLLVQFV